MKQQIIEQAVAKYGEGIKAAFETAQAVYDASIAAGKSEVDSQDAAADAADSVIIAAGIDADMGADTGIGYVVSGVYHTISGMVIKI